MIDDLIKLHKSMVETHSGVNSALSKALEESSTQLFKQQDFAFAIDIFQKQLLHDLESSGVEAQSLFRKLMKSLDAAVQILLGQFSLATKEAETAIAGLTKVSLM